MGYKVLIILLAVFIFGCASKKEISSRNRPMCAFADVAYIGTFSSISVIVNKQQTLFNDSLTAFATYMYDSVIRARVRNITPVNAIASLPSYKLKLLSQELTQKVLQFNEKDGLKSISTSCANIDSVAAFYDNRYSSYFIDFGNIWSKKQNRKHIAGQTLLVSAVIVGFAVLVVLAAASGGDRLGLFDPSGPPSQNYNEHGMNCYYLIYDKQDKKICYLKSSFFNSDKTDNNPFNALRVNMQIETTFNNCLK